jgi:peptide/nickel transport system substrate-binding protein
VPFDAGSAGFVVLRTGNEAGPWGAPGVAQQIIDGLPGERLQHLGLGDTTAEAGARIEWGGPRCELCYLQGSAQLAEIARVVASLISKPLHEVEPRPLPAAELSRRRTSGSYSLMIHTVRAPGGPGLPKLVALTTAVDPKSALDAERRPPKLASFAPKLLTRTLRLGVLGELRVTGAVAPDVFLAKGSEGWDLASSYRAPGAKRLP